MSFASRLLVAIAFCFCATPLNAFLTTPRSSVIAAKGVRQTRTSVALFEDDDVSAFNALCQFGPAPFFIRITQPEKYWEGVEKFQREEGCTRIIAVRNMDAYFSDPIGWALRREREKDYGEVIDYTRKSGVQKRPVFSVFMLVLTTWFFFFFMPHRIAEVGGIHPQALNGGFCPPDVRVILDNGKETFRCAPPGERSWPFN